MGARVIRKARFLVHKHDTTHTHYDFRIEIDGVLVSFAIPKGISTHPAHKRLAIRVSDHPMSYARFEGVIPHGEYGAGVVMVWDIGTCYSIQKIDGVTVPLSVSLQRGQIEIVCRGKKLHGAYALVRMLTKKDSWLLIKMKDAYAGHPIVDRFRSALTGRTMKQIRGAA